jgi:pyruvate dehydrogenase E2 component (dihydrolipoamide acetyltransferase)
VFISNVAPLGVEEVFLAPLPFARTPVYISLGVVTDRPVVRDGVVQVVPQFTLCLTGDHRLVDGVQCAVYFDALKRYLADPETLGG